MASSKVMASRSPPNPDRPRQQPSPPSAINLHSDPPSRGFASMNMDDLFRNIYPDSEAFAVDTDGGGAAAAGGGGGLAGDEVGLRNGNEGKTVDEVWREIVSGGAAAGGGGGEARMTLEDFLAKAGAVSEEDVRVPAVVTMGPPPPAAAAGGGFGMEAVVMNPAPGVPAVPFAPAICVQNGYGVEFGNGIAAASGSSGGGGGGSGGGGRGKRRAAVEEAPLDKATQQKQRRMIKNRESAARSRERKQAYTVELESLVTQLEEDNAKLLKEEVETRKERYKQLMRNIIPVVEKRRPQKLLKRVRSMEW